MLYVHTYYSCLSCEIVVSNGVTPGVTGDNADPLVVEIEEVIETPQGLVEWTPADVF